MEFTDRYAALGVPRPDPATMCRDQCEGTGVIPIYRDETNPVYRAAWEEAEAKEPAADGWHFIICPSCNGTGKKP